MSKNKQSCVGCAFLYLQHTGYSNWTIMDTDVVCAQERNSDLPASEPYDWDKEDDNWKPTQSGWCALYQPGEMVCFDVDGEDEFEEAVNPIVANHAGRDARGGFRRDADIEGAPV